MPAASAPASLTPPVAAPVCAALPAATQFTDLACLGQGRPIPGEAEPPLAAGTGLFVFGPVAGPAVFPAG